MTTGTIVKGNKAGPRPEYGKIASFLLLIALGLTAAMTTGCGAEGAQHSSASPSHPDSAEESVITVFAAASLTDVFSAISREYRLQNPGHRVVLNFDGSQRLRTQLEHGARADVFASADRHQMEAVADLGLTAIPPVNFASNRLVILIYAGPGGNLGALALEGQKLSMPGFRHSLETLAKPGTKIVLGHPTVPIGKYTEHLLEEIKADPALGQQIADGIGANVVSQEPSVRAIVQKVNLGEADAGVVYVSDAEAALAGVRSLHLPDSITVIAHYPIATLTRKPGASKFVDFVLSEPGQQILRNYRFGPPVNVEGANP